MPHKVGVVGSGAMGRNHVRAILSQDPENSVIVYDPFPTEIESSRVKFVPSMDELCGSGIDYSVVATPSSSHLEIATTLAESRIPSLIEKPLALDYSESVKIRDSFLGTETFGAVGHVERFSPAFSLLKQKVREGLVGEVGQISTRRVGPHSKRIRDVGVIFDLASHDVDLVLWIMGAGIEHFSAVGKSFLGLANEDTLLVNGMLTGGQFFSHEINWLTPRKAREVTVIGSGGMITASSITQQVTFYSNQNFPHDWGAFRDLTGDSAGESITYGISVREPLLAEHDAFQAGLEGKKTEICTLDEGVEVTRYLNEFKKSVASK
jgi:predicted dehydrogenase